MGLRDVLRRLRFLEWLARVEALLRHLRSLLFSRLVLGDAGARLALLLKRREASTPKLLLHRLILLVLVLGSGILATLIPQLLVLLLILDAGSLEALFCRLGPLSMLLLLLFCFG